MFNNVIFKVIALAFLRIFDLIQIVIQALIVLVIVVWRFLLHGRPGIERLLAETLRQHNNATRPNGNPQK